MLGRQLLFLAVLASSAVCQVPVVKAIESLNTISARLIQIRDIASSTQPVDCINFLDDDVKKRSGPWQTIETRATNLTELLFVQAAKIQRLPTITAFYTQDGARMYDASQSLEFLLVRLYDVFRSKAQGEDRALCMFLPAFGRRVANSLGGLHTGIVTYENAIDIFNPEYKEKFATSKAKTRAAVESAIGSFLVRV